MPREDLTLDVSQGFQTFDAPPDALYAEKRAWYMDVQGNSDTSPAFQVRRVSPTTGARTVLFTVTKSGDVNFTNTTFEAGDGTFGAPSYTFASETTLGLFKVGAGVLGVAGAVAFGATPALSGGLRLSNQTIITERNLANNGDVQMIYVNASDEVGLNGGSVLVGTGYLSIVSGSPATAGALRLPNGQLIAARNAANTQNIGIAYIDGSNDLQIGGGGDVAPGVVRFTPVAITIGTTPATSGAIRIPNNAAITSRNAANTANNIIAYLSGTDTVNIGNGAAGVVLEPPYVSIGSPAAGAGVIRIPNNAIIKARNAANSADVNLISVDGSDIIHIAENGQQVAIHGNIVAAVSFLSIGTTPAATGIIRIPNNQFIYARNAANSSDISIVRVFTSNEVILGDTAQPLWFQASAGNVDFRYATTALGGGAAPTVGTIGGAGPATAAQNSWLKVLINGTASYLPVWR